MTDYDEVQKECDRQMILLSLALTSLLRPGFDFALGEIAEKFNGREMFERFKRANDDVVKPTGSWAKPA